MSTDNKRRIYVIAWAVILAALMILFIATFGYEDEKNVTLAIMLFGVPMSVMIVDMLNFFRYEKYYTHGKFMFNNFLMVWGASFVLEGIVILVSFGIKHPQVKLFILAAIFSTAAAVLNLFQSGFLALVMKKKHSK